MHECENVRCFENVCAVAEDSWIAVVEDAARVTEVKAKETLVNNGLQNAGDGELGELHFRFARDVCKDSRVCSPTRVRTVQ